VVVRGDRLGAGLANLAARRTLRGSPACGDHVGDDENREEDRRPARNQIRDGKNQRECKGGTEDSHDDRPALGSTFFPRRVDTVPALVTLGVSLSKGLHRRREPGSGADLADLIVPAQPDGDEDGSP